MGNQPFIKSLSRAVPISQENIDTDQIIPARFLKATNREGFGKNLFCDWRYHEDGTEKPDFVLNQKKYSGEILIAGNNFGCGSSREHAAWALYDYGFRVVFSSYFADIFKSNALNNSILPIQVSADLLSFIFQKVEENPALVFEVDLEKEIWGIPSLGIEKKFEISSYKRTCILHGYDDLDYVLSHQKEILEFENRRFSEKKYTRNTR